tara:strand:- start:866 stop:1153 length:288 start_codon:yes stop_codon:yes gene_type:complete
MIEREVNVEKYLGTRIKDLGGICLKIPATYLAGIPDRLCLLPGGVLFFAELKTTKKKPSKIQVIIHNKLRALGFEVYVLDSKEEILKTLKRYEQR